MHDETPSSNLRRLVRRGLTLLVCKDGQELFCSKARGLVALVELLDACLHQLTGVTVVDRVTGGVAARLFLWQNVRRIDALVASQRALDVLRHSGVTLNHERLVPELLAPDHSQLDQAERLGIRHDHPEFLYDALRHRLESAWASVQARTI